MILIGLLTTPFQVLEYVLFLCLKTLLLYQLEQAKFLWPGFNPPIMWFYEDIKLFNNVPCYI
jgi:hypothetical protein